MFTEQQIIKAFPRSPWPHQLRGVTGLLEKLQGVDTVVMCSPTGGGKGLIQSALASLFADQGVVLYNLRRSLTDQAIERLDTDDIHFGVRSAAHKHLQNLSANVQVASLQTDVARILRQKTWEPHPCRLVLIDEAHLAMGPEYINLIQLYLSRGAKVVGVTGTPVGMSSAYKDIVVAGTNSEMRQVKAHVKAIVYAPHEMDTSKIKKVKTGEYREGDIVKHCWSQAVIGHIYDDFRRLNRDGRLTMAAAPGIAESVWLSNEFRERGHTVLHIDCNRIIANGVEYKNDPKGTVRQQALRDFRKGEYDILCNCETIQQGVDIPELGHLILARPYGSLANYLQTVGRVIRYSEKTPDLVTVQDHGGCLDEKTEILTSRGWLGIGQVVVGDEVAAFDTNTRKIEWKAVKSTYVRNTNADDVMHVIKSRCLDIRVTGNHKMVYNRRLSDKNGGYYWPVEYKKARFDEAAKMCKVKIPVAGEMNFPGVPLTESELKFLGWWITDGSRSRTSLKIYQSQTRYPEHVRQIRDVLIKCGFDFRESRIRYDRNMPSSKLHPERHHAPNYGYMSVFDVPKGTCKSKPRKGWSRLERYVDKDLSLDLMQMTKKQFEVLIHAMHMGDGSKSKGNSAYSISCRSKTCVDRVQEMAVLRGWKCNISKYKDRPLYSICLQKSDSKIVQGHGKGNGNQARIETENPKAGERVWCAENDLGTLVTRRNGKVAIVGNSYHRHGSPNEDRDWEKLFTQSEKEIAKEREQQIRKDKIEEPITCGQCGMVRKSGNTCPGCGQASEKSVRIIVQQNGELKRMTGRVYPRDKDKPVVAMEQQRWDQIFWSQKKYGNMTFAQAKGWYKKKYGEEPPTWLKKIPKDKLDDARRIRDVDWKDLS